MIDMNELVEKINSQIEANVNCLNDEIEKDIVYHLLSGNDTFYEVDHSCDPPWDWSGRIVENGHIDIKTTSFSEYLEMYNGTSYPSFWSGHGMFHRSNSDDVDEIIMSWAFNVQREVILTTLMNANKLELYSWLMDGFDIDYIDAESGDDFVLNFNDYVDDICDSIVYAIDGETIAFFNHEIVELLSVFQTNPMLSQLVKKHRVEIMRAIERDRKEAERQRTIATEVNKELHKFIAALKEKLPNTNDFFKGRRITREKENNDLRKEFFERFTHEEIALIAYFESYRFSNSMIADLPKDIEKMIEEERSRLRAIYEKRYPPEQEEV